MTTPHAPSTTLWQMIWQTHRSSFVWAVCLNIINALVGIGCIAYINHYLLSQSQFDGMLLVEFLAIIAVLLFITLMAQRALTVLGHRFVYELRCELLKRILDTDTVTLQHIGSPKLLASLSHDIQAISMAFVRLPELVQGVVFCVFTALYLAYLSLPLLLLSLVWISFSVWVALLMVKKVYHYLEELRHTNDELYQDYQFMIDGAELLKLNRHRAKAIYQTFKHHAKKYRLDIIHADTFHLSAVNWSNIMMFGAIGVILAVSQIYTLTTLAVATTFCLTIQG